MIIILNHFQNLIKSVLKQNQMQTQHQLNQNKDLVQKLKTNKRKNKNLQKFYKIMTEKLLLKITRKFIITQNQLYFIMKNQFQNKNKYINLQINQQLKIMQWLQHGKHFANFLVEALISPKEKLQIYLKNQTTMIQVCTVQAGAINMVWEIQNKTIHQHFSIQKNRHKKIIEELQLKQVICMTMAMVVNRILYKQLNIISKLLKWNVDGLNIIQVLVIQMVEVLLKIWKKDYNFIKNQRIKETLQLQKNYNILKNKVKKNEIYEIIFIINIFYQIQIQNVIILIYLYIQKMIYLLILYKKYFILLQVINIQFNLNLYFYYFNYIYNKFIFYIQKNFCKLKNQIFQNLIICNFFKKNLYKYFIVLYLNKELLLILKKENK